jgi:hypothetical protein
MTSPAVLSAILLLESLIEGTIYDKYVIDSDTCAEIRVAIERLEDE